MFVQVSKLKPDGFEPKIVRQTDDYLDLEYTSPIMGVSSQGRGGLDCLSMVCNAQYAGCFMSAALLHI